MSSQNISPIQRTVSIIFKIIVILSAVIGTFLSAYAGRNSFMGGWFVFMYFTIQSNIALAIVCGIGLHKLIKNKPITNTWNVIKFIATVSITLTGAVFCFVLAPTMGSAAWNLQNILTHVIVPIVSILDFFVIETSFKIKKINTFLVILPPIVYAIYAGIGYILGWEFAEGINYPYFFLNWGSPAGAWGFTNELPFMGCMWWILALLVLLLLTGFIYLLVIDGLRKLIKNPTMNKISSK